MLRAVGIVVLVAAQALLLCSLPTPPAARQPTAPASRSAAARPLAPAAGSHGKRETGTRRQDFQRLLAEVQNLRGLRFRRPVPSYRQSRDDMRRYLRKELDQDTNWARESAVVKQFGFVPESFRLRDFTMAFYTEQVAGYYDYHTRSFYMIDDALGSADPGTYRGLTRMLGTAPSALDDSMVIHEMDHALQDQHFSLAALDRLTSRGQQDDFSQAVQSLIEGDATLVMFAPIFQQMGMTLRDAPPLDAVLKQADALAGMGGGAQFDRAPRYFRRMALFPYLSGATFVGYFQTRGGWAAVNRIYHRLPASTAQIIHPAKYAAGIRPRLPALAPATALPGGWREVVQNTMGEERVSLLLEQHLPDHLETPASTSSPGTTPSSRLYSRADSARVAAGWSGDRFRIYAAGGRRFLVWSTVWSSAPDAVKFADAMRQVEARRNRLELVRRVDPHRPAARWQGAHAGLVWDVERCGNRVFVLEGVPLALEEGMLDLATGASYRQGNRRRSVNYTEIW